MSHYADYINERLGKLCYTCNEGFAVYLFPNNNGEEVVYIEEIYVAPAFRKQGVATQMADYIAEAARGRGIKTMYGSVNPKARGSTDSLKVLLKYGMSLDHIGNDGLIYLSKSLEA